MKKKETISILKDFNAHLRNEVHELKEKLKEAEEKAQSNYNDMIDTRLENYDLECTIEKLQSEIATLKSQKGSIFTGPSKRETELERQLESECMRADELSEKYETLQKRYDEATQAVKELTDERDALNDQVKSMRHDLMTRFMATKQEGKDHDDV